jgi:5-oxoprolinase (ATP-hydrolysing)
MDDGSPISLTLTIDRNKREACFDFSGTGHEVLSNFNCPKSVVMSAIIYCLRCMVDSDIPLNQGCLKPITCIIPESTLLNPSENAPIGNKKKILIFK